MRIVAGVLFLVSLSFAGADALAMTDDWSGTAMRFVDPLIGTEGCGSEYGGMMPMTGVPFGSFQAVAMTRTNAIGRTSFNALDEKLLGVILARQPAIWMGDWGEVRVEVPPAKIGTLDAKPYLTRVTAGGRKSGGDCPRFVRRMEPCGAGECLALTIQSSDTVAAVG